MLNLYVVGCGGIGGYLLELLPMCIASLNLDLLSKHTLVPTLESDGKIPLPSVVDRITLIDGDVFDSRNAIRQTSGETTGSKVVGRLERFLAYRNMTECNSGLLATWLSALEVQGAVTYLNPDNISEIIPRDPAPNPVNENLLYTSGAQRMRDALRRARPGVLENKAVVFLCVDNDKTRLEVAKYMETFDCCLLISGGNTKTTGNVLVYERVSGFALDPPIYEMFSNIANPKDKRPDEISCGEVAPSHDQVANTNCMIATWMSVLFSRWVRDGLGHPNERVNEVLINTDTYTVDGVRHMV